MYNDEAFIDKGSEIIRVVFTIIVKRAYRKTSLLNQG